MSVSDDGLNFVFRRISDTLLADAPPDVEKLEVTLDVKRNDGQITYECRAAISANMEVKIKTMQIQFSADCLRDSAWPLVQ